MNVAGGGIERRAKNIAFVKSDSSAVGREAANALLRQGIYKSYGYAGYRTDEDWSRERGTAFRDALDKAGFVGRMMDVAHYSDKVEDKATILKWLRDLPKPCGIFAACDDRAFEILDICRDAGIKVPAEAGVLAAELLDRMMSGGSIPAKRRLNKVGIRAIVHRESTVSQSESGKFVQKVLSYIGREAVKGIGVEDVAKHFKISRSLLEMRFRELQNESVYEAMLRIRLEEVKRRLRQTKDPIAQITAECGWENPEPPKVLFKKRFGVSMRDFRKRGA